MKLETIKKDNKKKIIIGSMIVLSVVGCITLTTTRAKYKSVQSVKLASGTVKLNSYDFKVMAMYQSEDGKNYTDITTMPETGYVINEEKSYCTTDNKEQVKGKLKTIDGNHVMIGLKKSDRCYIWFDKKKTPSEETLAKLNVKNIKSGTPDFTIVATGAETEVNNGIFKVNDGMYGGSSYYWRGAATTNHVIFDNKCWRIVRINGDGSIRLIYNGAPSGNTCSGNGSNSSSIALSREQYNSDYSNSSYVGWTYTASSQRPSTANPQTSGTASAIKTTIENWYSSNISTSAKIKVVAGKFCNDRNIGSGSYSGAGSTFYYAPYARNNSSSSANPTLSCLDGDIYELNVGLITADEVTYAGASGTASNTSYYLYNGQYYWTISPSKWSGCNTSAQSLSGDASYNVVLCAWADCGYAYVFCVNSDGSLGTNSTLSSYGSALRPVINLRSDVTFNAGSDGTQNNPYIVQ